MDDFIVVLPEEEDRSIFSEKMTWDKRAALIKEMYPSTAFADFHKIFAVDPMSMKSVIDDIMKREAPSTGRPGKIPAVSSEDAAQYIKRYQNDDYTIYEFKEAFRFLKGDRSVRHMARRCGLSVTMVQRLLDGRAVPSVPIMESVARAFKKHPSFFIEYRIAYVVGVLTYRMQAVPEASVVPYMKLRGDAEKEWK